MVRRAVPQTGDAARDDHAIPTLTERGGDLGRAAARATHALETADDHAALCLRVA